MLKSFFSILFFAIITTTFSQDVESRAISSFSALKSSSGIDVYLKKGAKEGLKVEVMNGKLSDVLTDVSGNTLRIQMRSGSFRKINVKVYVTYVKLETLSSSSGSSIFSDGKISSTMISLQSSSGAAIEVTIEAETTTVNVSSGSNVRLDGKTKFLEAEASSAGNIDAYNVESEKVQARASSGGSIKINASVEIEAHASSGGSIRYRGNPSKTNTGSSSGGSVKKSN